MKATKNAQERRREILDVAEDLFLGKGYQQTTIVDILSEVGIAKGTFYYYFKSKEEVMDAIIERILREDVIRAKAIAKDPEIRAVDKIFRIFFSQKIKAGSRKAEVIAGFDNPNNAEMRQKSLVKAVHLLSPILAEVVIEGVNQGVFKTDYPQETTELLIVSGQILFDKGWFSWSESQTITRANAFVKMMEHSLGAAKGSFQPMLEVLINPHDGVSFPAP